MSNPIKQFMFVFFWIVWLILSCSSAKPIYNLYSHGFMRFRNYDGLPWWYETMWKTTKCVCVSVCSPSVQWPLNGGNSYLCWFGSMEVVLDRWIGMIQARFQWDAGGWPLPLEMSPVNYPPWYQKAGNFWCFGRSMVDVCLRRNLPVFQRSCCTAAVHRTSITTPTLCWQQKAIVRLMRRHWNMWWLMTNLLSGWWMVACQVYSMNSPWSMIFRK